MLFKKIISCFMAFLMTTVCLTTKVNAADSSHTCIDALQWAKSKVGTYIDADGMYGAQCVDFIFAYYDYLGVPRSYGNGKDFATNALPAGWTRTYKGTPQPGDILVYTGDTYGHVGIYESDYSSYHQNYNWSYVAKSDYSDISSSNYWGCIHPNFKPLPTSQVTFDLTIGTNNLKNRTISITKGSDWYSQLHIAFFPYADDRSLAFMGYYSEKEGGKMVFDASLKAVNGTGYWQNNQWIANGNVKLYARWQKLQPGWNDTDNGRTYVDDNGRRKSGVFTVDGVAYYGDSGGYLTKGWVSENLGMDRGYDWFYVYDDGTLAKGWLVDGGRTFYLQDDYRMQRYWKMIDGKYYYFGTDGIMVKNKWVGEYYLGADGVMATNTWIGQYHVDANGKKDGTRQIPQWMKTGNRWWYRHADGSYTKNGWEEINGERFHFDKEGYLTTNQWVGDYYVGSDGRIQKNQWIGNYYVDATGKWDKTKVKPSQWLQSGNKWWYRHGDGSYTKNGWEKIDGDWYYFDKDGWMLTNQWIGNYYVTASGRMAKNTWIGNYHVNADGVWDDTKKPAAQWIQSGNRWWYKHSDGSYTKNGWEKIGGDWYYFDKDGWMLANQWIGNYYVTASGRMAKNTWIGKYHVGADGLWDNR